MSPRRPHHEEAFRSAIEAHDFPGAESALREYVAWFKSESRSLQEIEAARDLLAWGIQLTTVRRVRLTDELMRLRTVLDAYLPRKPFETWRVIG
jgi:hypothetical protein